MILDGEFSAFEIVLQNDCKAIYFSFLELETSKIDHIWIEHDHILPSANHKSTLLRFWFTYKAQNVGIVEKETRLNQHLIFNFFKSKVNHM